MLDSAGVRERNRPPPIQVRQALRESQETRQAQETHQGNRQSPPTEIPKAGMISTAIPDPIVTAVDPQKAPEQPQSEEFAKSANHASPDDPGWAQLDFFE